LIDFEALEKLDLSKVKIMWTNYPHMPTGAAGSMDVFERLIAFARKHQILLVNDNPYSCVGYENKISIHQVAGSKEVALELNSISKTYNMAGWRVGMLTGKAEVLKEVLKVKTNMDSGMFYGVQKGAIAALETNNNWLESQNNIYKNRRNLIVELAKTLGLQPQEQAGGLFVWCKLPEGQHNDKVFVDQLLYEKNIFIAPGSVFGKNGAGYVRFSLCVNEEQIKEMIERVSNNKVEA
jgi:aspartate/methionine/tyrosine aminotransferase